MALNTFCTTNLATALSDETENLWTTARVAQMLNRPERSVRRMVQRGDIKGFKVRGRFGEEWRIMPFEILDARPANNDHDRDDDENNGGKSYNSVGIASDFESEFATERKSEHEMCNASIQAPCQSAWQIVLTYFRSLLVWLSKNGKASSIVEY